MEILTKNNVALYQKCHEVPSGEDRSELIEIMWKLMSEKKGIGLAANQIGALDRIIIIHVNGFSSEIINPVITKRSGKTKISKSEGCLSFPGKRINKKRDNQIVVEGFDRNRNPIRKKLRALGAFVVQHEIDHLNGITILDRD